MIEHEDLLASKALSVIGRAHWRWQAWPDDASARGAPSQPRRGRQHSVVLVRGDSLPRPFVAAVWYD